MQKPLSQELDTLGRLLAISLALEYQGNTADSHQRWNTIGQTMLALYLIDNKWGNWQSVESTVKTNQSEGIAAPTIPEEGH